MKKIIITAGIIYGLASCKVANKTNISSTNNSLRTPTNFLATNFDSNTGLTLSIKGLEVESIESFKLTKEFSGVLNSSSFKNSGDNVEITIGESASSSSTPLPIDIKLSTKNEFCETLYSPNDYLADPGTGVFCSPKETPTPELENGLTEEIADEDLTSSVVFSLEDQSPYTGFPLPPRTNYTSLVDEDAFCIDLFNTVEQEFPDALYEVCF